MTNWLYSHLRVFRQSLVQSLSDEKLDARYHVVAPTEGQRWIIAPGAHQSAWAQWRKLPDIFGEGFKGVQPGRGGALVAIDRAPLVEQMTAYVDPDVSETAVRERYSTLMNDEAGYDANKVRRAVLEQDTRADAASFLSVLWLPFDVRTLYWKSGAGIVHRARPEFREQVHGGNHFLAITQRPRKDYSPPLVTTLLGSYYVFDPYTSYFPLWRHAEDLTGVSHDAAVTEDMLQSLCAANDIAMYPARRTLARWSNEVSVGSA